MRHRRTLCGATIVVAVLVAAGPLLSLEPAAAQEGGRAAEERPPEVSVAGFGWLAGSWRGAGPSGTEAAIRFMEPSGGVLPAVFRLSGEGRVVLLELATMVEEEDGLHMYVRHFSPDLSSMEEDGAIDLRLAAVDGEAYRFENTRTGNPTVSVLRRTGPASFVSTSVLSRPDGSVDTLRVSYRRSGDVAP